jgi:hypothetical protein
MKIRLILSFVVLIFFLAPVRGQFKYGIRGGINSSNVHISQSVFNLEADDPQDVPDQYLIEYRTGSLGFHIGGLVQYYFGEFFIQPEILYSYSKNDVRITRRKWIPDANGLGSWDEDEAPGLQKFNKVNVPVLAGYRIGPLRVMAGPMASVMIGTKFENLEGYTIEQKFTSSHFGYQVSIGLELTSLNIDVKYEGALTPFGEGLTVNGNDFIFDQKMGQWILSIGFVLGDY